MRELWRLLKETYSEWSRHEAPRLGAALAYYTILAMAPLLIVVIAVIGLAFGHEAARGQIVGQISGLVGPAGARAVQTIVANAKTPSSGIIATIIGVVTLFVGASGVFVELQGALNKIWDVPPKQDESIWQMVRARFLSFGMVLAVGFVLLVSLVISAGLAATGAYFAEFLPVPAWVLQLANSLVSLGVFAFLFAMIYRVLPDQTIAWKDTLFGAVVTAVLFTVGKFLIGLYLGQASFVSSYGAAGSLVIVLVWVYYSAQVFFLGAEFTHVFAHRHGSRAGLPPVQTGGGGLPAAAVLAAREPLPTHESVRTEPDLETRKEEAARGGSGISAREEDQPQLWLVAALGGLAWWRGRSRKRAESD